MARPRQQPAAAKFSFFFQMPNAETSFETHSSRKIKARSLKMNKAYSCEERKQKRLCVLAGAEIFFP
jgi:hypothetical protein